MDLTIYDIIKGPVISDKAILSNRKYKKLVLRVHQDANKPLIKQALEKLFDVKVEKVNCLNRPGKTRRVGRRIIQRSASKIAVVTLKEGYSLDLFERAGDIAVMAEAKQTISTAAKKA
ncbi:MAG: 50S ribosomal protein L23 [Candidatus Dependentiae bacterium]|nr:50S ribosomal protein L23 [Candidatus Dependentiae bacterium]